MAVWHFLHFPDVFGCKKYNLAVDTGSLTYVWHFYINLAVKFGIWHWSLKFHNF